MHQGRKLLKQRNKLFKRLREILTRPKIAAAIFGKSFVPPILSTHELETDVETDSDDSTVDEILTISLEYLSKDSGQTKGIRTHKADYRTLPFDIRDLQQTEITLEFALHTFSILKELDDP